MSSQLQLDRADFLAATCLNRGFANNGDGHVERYRPYRSKLDRNTEAILQWGRRVFNIYQHRWR